MSGYQNRLLRLLTLFVALIIGAALPSSFRTARAEATPLTSSPTAIDVTVTLETTAQATVTIQNSSGSSVTPRLYEALAATAEGASLMAALPSDLAHVSLPDQEERVDPDLAATIAAEPAVPTEFLVFLTDQANLSAAYTIDDWNERGQYVYTTLRDHAEESQAGLRALLDARGVRYTPLWIVNALAVEGDAADLAALNARTEVALIRANHLLDVAAATSPTTTLNQVTNCFPNAANVCWNLVRIGADRVWDYFGVRGTGITVANIDSGVNYAHPALIAQYRGNIGGGFDHNYNWFDPYANSSVPVDSGDHGTHTMGTIAARGGASVSTPAVGVAPNVKWIAARGCGASQCSDIALISAAQWMLAPTDLNGAYARTDLRPQIINNSWSSGVGNNTWYTGYVAAWRASGIFPVFAAGNAGNATCSTVKSPGDYAQVVGVGALDSANQIASFSSVGPSLDGRLKPDLVAPGNTIASTFANGTYGSMNGTSMATPHVVGSVALIWSANPSLIGDYDRTYQILTQSAIPISGDTRFDSFIYSLCHASSAPNNIYGYGQLDVYRAVTQAIVDVPWLTLPSNQLTTLSGSGTTNLTVTIDGRRLPGPGTYQARILVHGDDLTQTPLVIPVTVTVLPSSSYATVSGRITRSADGSPLAGRVSVAGGATVNSDANGNYQIVLPPSPDSYTITATSFDYAAQAVTMTLIASETRTQDFALGPDIPRLTTETRLLADNVMFGTPRSLSFTLRNEGSKTLTYSARIPVASFGVWRSEQADGPTPTWITPPDDAITIALGDDGVSSPLTIGFSFPFFSSQYTSVSISANGVLSFTPFSSFGSYVSGCLPASEATDAAIIPLRVDLNASSSGRISYARTTAGFLVTWEDVPLFSAPTQRLSFQVLLRPDGRVSLNYLDLDGLSVNHFASAGVQQTTTNVQSLGCGSSLSLQSGQSIELRPQAETTAWATLPIPSGTIAPGAQVNLPVNLNWAYHAWAWPTSADILITSNDLTAANTILAVRATMTDAPYRVALPIIIR